MEEQEYLKMYKYEKNNWYFVSRRNFFFLLLDKYIKNKNNKILDIGSGTGLILKKLSKYGDAIGLDFKKKVVELSNSRGLNCKYGNAEDIPFENESFDIVTAFGVIEHVDDDKKALNEIARVLKKNSYLMLECPAYNFLWSQHDVALHHKRRYTLSVLKKKVEDAGFEIEKISYIYSAIFIPTLILRVFRNIFGGKEAKTDPIEKLPYNLNKLIIEFEKLEALLIRRINLPFGVAILCLAKKK